MVALKRFVLFVFLAGGLCGSTTWGATLSLGLPVGSNASSAEPFTIDVTLQALAVTGSKYVRSSWLDEVNVRAFDANGNEIPIRVVARRNGESIVVRSKAPRNGVREDGLGFSAELDVDVLLEGRTTISVEYQDLKNEITLIPRGVEKQKPRVLRSEGAGNQKRTYEKYRADAMRRLEESPYDWVILWNLGTTAIEHASQEEAEEYLRKSLEAQAAYIELKKNSEDPLRRAGLQSVEKELQKNKAIVGAVLSLLPEYYANREKTQLVIDGMMGQVVLKDRETYKTIKAVRFSAFAERVAENDAP